MKVSKETRLLFIRDLLLAATIFGLGALITINSTGSSLAENSPVPTDARRQLNEISTALSQVAAAVSPSVVNVSTTKSAPQQTLPNDLYNHPFFRRFFDVPGLPGRQPQEKRASALGSGVIVSSNGHILTNNHVIDSADKIVITLHDRRTFEAELVGADPKTDLALIKIDAFDLPVLELNDDRNLQVGEIVVAVGIPFGLSHTVTMGIVSAVGRSNVGIVDYEDFIQTDAAINPGNSGGALVNSAGELVGINTAIFSTSGGNMGVGFAIPVEMAQSVMDSLLEHGKVIRGWLGVNIQDMTPDLADYFNRDKNDGALISGVVPGSPAANAGLEQQDIVVSFNGTEIQNATDLKNQVAVTPPESSVKLHVVRDGKKQTITVVLGELPADGTQAAAQTTAPSTFYGAHLQNLSPELRAQLSIPDSVNGVLVSGVERDGAAGGVLQQGDVISQINRKKISSVRELQKIREALDKEQNILLLVHRSGGSLYLTLKP